MLFLPLVFYAMSSETLTKFFFIEESGSHSLFRFPFPDSEKIEWHMTCDKPCTMHVFPTEWTVQHQFDWDGVWDLPIWSPVATVIAEHDNTHAVMVLTSWRRGVPFPALLVAAFGSTVTLAVLVAAVGVILIMAFCWEKEHRGRPEYEPL